jgi:hypothetical protein
MISKELRHAVIGMLAAWGQVVAEMPDDETDDAEIPPELLPALGAAAPSASVTVHWPGGLMPVGEAQRLVDEAAEAVTKGLTLHYGGALTYMTTLFVQLAREAWPVVDLSEFLQREALHVATMGAEPGG